MEEHEGLLNVISALMDRLDRHMGDTDPDDPHDPDLQVMQWAASVLKAHQKERPPAPADLEQSEEGGELNLDDPNDFNRVFGYSLLDEMLKVRIQQAIMSNPPNGMSDNEALNYSLIIAESAFAPDGSS